MVIYCDNQASCIIINTGKAKCSFLQKCLRELCFLSSLHECLVKAVHLEGSKNRIPDCLSRWHLGQSYRDEFLKLTRQNRMQELQVMNDVFKFTHSW